ncbi:MAG: STAS domain-containing protein [Terrimicrobiaceae bacterium]|nr:STAS domain-containing protein [Terrimicrobiaceae bacterium]
MKIEERREGRVVVLSVEGRLDHAGAEIFDAHVSRLIAADERALVIDFHGVDFVASMGIRALIKPYQALAQQGGRIVVANLGESVRSVFRLAGIDQAVPIYDSVGTAVAALA